MSKHQISNLQIFTFGLRQASDRFQRLFPTFCCDGNGFGFNTNAKRCYHRLSGLSGRGELRFSSGDDLSWLRVCREVSRGRRKFLRAAAMDARIAAIKTGRDLARTFASDREGVGRSTAD